MEQTITLSPKQKDEYLNQLLVYMKNDLEAKGISNPKHLTFNFESAKLEKYFNADDKEIPAGEDRIDFLSKHQISDEEFNIVLNFAITHKFIANLYRGYKTLYITEDGIDRAMSVERATYKPAVGDSTQITFNGPVNATNLQAGNNNTQNISNTFYQLIDEIKRSNTTEEEKKTALTMLKDFINNPIISGIISGSAVELMKFLTKMGI